MGSSTATACIRCITTTPKESKTGFKREYWKESGYPSDSWLLPLSKTLTPLPRKRCLETANTNFLLFGEKLLRNKESNVSGDFIDTYETERQKTEPLRLVNKALSKQLDGLKLEEGLRYADKLLDYNFSLNLDNHVRHQLGDRSTKDDDTNSRQT
jgi:hypothetical protein